MNTDKQIELVMDSWESAAANRTKAGKIFYDRLFKLAPSAKNEIEGDISIESRRLIMRLTDIVRDFKSVHKGQISADEYGQQLKKLLPEHKEAIKNALLYTIAFQMGKYWDDKTSSAWNSVLEDFIEAIKK